MQLPPERFSTRKASARKRAPLPCKDSGENAAVYFHSCQKGLTSFNCTCCSCQSMKWNDKCNSLIDLCVSSWHMWVGSTTFHKWQYQLRRSFTSVQMFHTIAQNNLCEFWCGTQRTCKNTNTKLTRRMKIYIIWNNIKTYNHSRHWP